MAEVAMKTTPLDMMSVAEQIRLTHGDLTPWAMAQISLETANGTKCQNWNVGNISRWKGAEGDYWVPPWVTNTSHRLHAKWKQGKVPGAFWAYSDQESGVRHYLERLERDFPEILAGWENGSLNTVWAAIRKHYMPDELAPEEEARAKQGFYATAQKWAKLLGIGQFPKAPKAAPTKAQPPADSSSHWPPRRLLLLGSVGPDVAELNRRLGLVSGDTFTAATHAAVVGQQWLHHCGIDGKVGPETLARVEVLQ